MSSLQTYSTVPFQSLSCTIVALKNPGEIGGLGRARISSSSLLRKVLRPSDDLARSAIEDGV